MTTKKTTDRGDTFTADMFAALSVAAEHAAKYKWEAACVHLREALAIAPTDQARQAITLLLEVAGSQA